MHRLPFLEQKAQNSSLHSCSNLKLGSEKVLYNVNWSTGYIYPTDNGLEAVCMFTCIYMFMYISIYAHICVNVYVYTIIHVCNCSLQKTSKWSYWHCHIISNQLASSNFFSLRLSFQVPPNNRALSFPRCPPVGTEKVLRYESSTLILYKELSRPIFQSLSVSQ